MMAEHSFARSDLAISWLATCPPKSLELMFSNTQPGVDRILTRKLACRRAVILAVRVPRYAVRSGEGFPLLGLRNEGEISTDYEPNRHILSGASVRLSSAAGTRACSSLPAGPGNSAWRMIPGPKTRQRRNQAKKSTLPEPRLKRRKLDTAVESDNWTFRPTVLVRRGSSQGTGTIIASLDRETLVLTAGHVIRGRGPILVELHRYNLGIEHQPTIPGKWPRRLWPSKWP